MRIGDGPSNRLEKKGIKVFSTYDRIEDAVKNAAQSILKVSGGI
jgi:predicted Fe-Mo cluster-binding NifX family protein